MRRNQSLSHKGSSVLPGVCDVAKELYMVVERYKDAEVVYERLWNRGRIKPEGLEFVQSWFDENVERGYRLECKAMDANHSIAGWRIGAS